MPFLTHNLASLIAAFLASLVEFVEALTVVLAVGVTRGWRGALSGTALALGVLALLVLVFGPVLTRLPLRAVQLGVGVLLLLFGLRWLRKAVLRAAGCIALHDEAASFQRSRAWLRKGAPARGWDRVGMATSFQIVMLEGVEVVFIVVALGAAGGTLWPAIVGALAALLVVMSLGAALHRPLARVPENTLKFVVGCLLSGFGTFWTGEAIGVRWPAADWSLVWLVAGYLAVALLLVAARREGHAA